MRWLLGISAFYHDSAAVLLRDGKVVAAAQEERFTRRKNDPGFPTQAIAYCMRHGGIRPGALSGVVFYDKPIVKFTRMLETFLTVAPAGWRVFTRVMPEWFSEKLNVRKTIRTALRELPRDCPILFASHHQSHAASAFYPSPFEEAAIVTADGVGEWATTTIGRGSGHAVELIEELHFPHSLGLLYSAFTAYCGFQINSGEYKLMGLAPFGEPKFVQTILDHLLDLKADGSFRLNLDYFSFLTRDRMTNARFDALFGGPNRLAESPIHDRYLHVARSIQAVTEEVMIRLARRAREVTGLDRLCLAGGVALNCVANGRILREGLFRRLWIQPAAGDAGGALGAALAVWHQDQQGVAMPDTGGATTDAMQGALLGPCFSEAEIIRVLQAHQACFERLEDDVLFRRVARLLSEGKIVGWFHGRMEFGPRALGNRSILGDARSTRMQSVMNRKIKFRESFRPFAPIVKRDRVADYFELDEDSPYMLLVAPVIASLRKQPQAAGLRGLDRIQESRSSIPAVTHVDNSARIQTLTRDQNPRLHALLEQFEQLTGCGLLVNTSFNVRGEPIVCSPDDAYRCFINTEMDYLVLENFMLDRRAQPKLQVAQTFEPILD